MFQKSLAMLPNSDSVALMRFAIKLTNIALRAEE
jgi:hypothetical protein